MSAPTILLTGGAGYLGRIVLRQLFEDLSAGKIVRLISTDIRKVREDQRQEGIDYEIADIRDAARLKTLMDQYNPSTVIHLAAVIDSHSMPRKVEYQIDVEGTRNIVEACLHAGVHRLIVSSSGAAYGYHADNPDWLTEAHPLRGNATFVYSDHKRQVEELLAIYRESHPELEQTILRLSTVLGATTDNLITSLFHRKSMLGVKGYDSPFVFIWDEDAAACFRHAVFSPVTGIFNVAGDGAIPARQLAILMGKPYLAIPPGLFRLLLRVLHTLRISPYGPEQMRFLQFRPVLDNRRLKEEFGFQPRKTSKEAFECYFSR